MQREIKFRAFHPEENKMYEIDLLSYMCMNESAQDDDMPSEARHNGLMQYTGLKDKNGKDIYEDDILRFGNPVKIGQVKWQNQGGAFHINYKHNTKSYFCEMMADYGDENGMFLTDTEVIGNIYENKELAQ